MGGGGPGYNAATPIVEGDTLILAGQGLKALRVEKQGDAFATKELWSNNAPEVTVRFNTPVLKDGRLYGLTGANGVFCVDAKTGTKLWSGNLPVEGGGGPMGSGFGSAVDAGSVLVALTPAAELVAFKPSDKEFSEVAKVKVADTPTYAYPVLAGNRLIIKDRDSMLAYALE